MQVDDFGGPGYGQSIAMAPGLRRVLARNPSPMTKDGTNSYLIGSGDLALIDPGPDDPEHLAALLRAVRPGERISHILVTHAHRDHSGLAPALARATGAAVLAYGEATAGRSPTMTALAARGGTPGGEGVDTNFRPDAHLADGQKICGGDWQITALHTPGHFGNHLCFCWGDAVFSGDHVMGWSTSIVAPPDGDMGAYMASLDKLAHCGARRLYPGHGATIDAPAIRIAELIAHRHARAAAITDLLMAGPTTATAIAAQIYRDIPAKMMPAAAMNVFAHLIDMTEKIQAVTLDPLQFSARFRAV